MGTLITDVNATTAARQSRYGTLQENGLISQDLKNRMRASPKWEELAADQKEALDMIQHKVSRILAGDVTYADNWHDIAGYASVIDKRLVAEQSTPIASQ
jgi:hypothetical protein